MLAFAQLQLVCTIIILVCTVCVEMLCNPRSLLVYTNNSVYYPRGVTPGGKCVLSQG